MGSQVCCRFSIIMKVFFSLSVFCVFIGLSRSQLEVNVDLDEVEAIHSLDRSLDRTVICCAIAQPQCVTACAGQQCISNCSGRCGFLRNCGPYSCAATAAGTCITPPS